MAGQDDWDSTNVVDFRAFITWLDSTRQVNLRSAHGELKKRDIWLTIALSVGTAGTMIVAVPGTSDAGKAAVSGIASALVTLATALNAKFKHEEDATQSTHCAKRIEHELLALRFMPETSWVKRRDSIAVHIQAEDCHGVESRGSVPVPLMR